VGRDAAAYRELADFIAKADKQQREGNQNLQSLLIMPIQRVPRYVMLLQVRSLPCGAHTFARLLNH
jgi:uncharacterized protein Yka (UPF0111/DUF47 family)